MAARSMPCVRAARRRSGALLRGLTALALVGCDPGSQSPVPIVLDQGGPKLANPQLVVITFADDPNRSARETMTRWLVTSDWLTTVGAEYGIGSGSILGMVERADNAPDFVTDADIQNLLIAGIADGSIPRPADATLPPALYVVFYPAHTTITWSAPGAAAETSCHSFLGYHAEARNATLHFPYAVIAQCDHLVTPPTPEQYVQLSTSHEIIEAVTDPFFTSAPAYRILPASRTGWAAFGGELADLCGEPSLTTTENGYMLQRVWSNRMALSRAGNPCVPAPAQPPYYYGVTISPDTWRAVSPGETVTFTVRGFSFGPVDDWAMLVLPPHGSPRPTATLSATHLNDGETATLTVVVPTSVRSGWTATLFVDCHLPGAESFDAPVAFYAP